MIGRGAYGRPWFLKNIQDYLKDGEVRSAPSLDVQKELLLEHFADIISHHGEQVGIKMARKHVSWYSKGLKESNEFRVKIMQSKTADEIHGLIKNFYDDLLQTQG